MKQSGTTVLIPLSGFLGAGKTSLMLAAAEQLRARGLRVACIANDQGQLLVDAKSVQHRGLPVGEVRGGCFCCKFNELTDTINVIIAAHRPDVILAEAVGSCTDLNATVVRPLRALHFDSVQPRPITTVIDPLRLEELLISEHSGAERLTPEVEYIVRKQLEEGSFLLLSKADTLPAFRMETLLSALRCEYPRARVLSTSSMHGQGIHDWLEEVMAASPEAADSLMLDIDYDTYAAGEAQLGWLNLSCSAEGVIPDVTEACRTLMTALVDGLSFEGAEIGHLKLWAQDGAHAVKLSSVRNGEPGQVDVMPPGPWRSDQITIWINARVLMGDRELERRTLQVLKRLENALTLEITVHELECFAPSRPVPVHRMEALQ